MSASALTSYSTSDSETVKIWSKKLHYEVMQRTVICNPSYGLISKKATSLCQEYDELQKGPGDRIRATLIKQLSGAGVMGTDNLAGREEGLQSSTFDFTIDKFRHGVGTNGEITDQRVSFDTMDEAKEKLADWWAARLECWAATQLCGWTATGTSAYVNPGGDQIDGSDLRYTGGNTPVDPGGGGAADTAHVARVGGGAEDENLTSSDLMDVDIIETAIAKAKQVTNPLRPIRYKGRAYYLCFLHPNQVRDLRLTSSNWYSLMTNALQGGAIDNNPLFTGSLGVVSDVIFKEWYWISPGINSSTGAAFAASRRAVFAGAQALCVGYGKRYGKSRMKWTHESEDHDDKYYAGAGMIAGMAATRYDSQDFGKIIIPSYAAEAV